MQPGTPTRRRNSMSLKSKIRSALAAAAVAATALACVAGPATAATPTKVTTHAESGAFYGVVKSSNPNCVSERTVVLFKQLGATQDPRHDQRILSDTSESDGWGTTGGAGA